MSSAFIGSALFSVRQAQPSGLACGATRENVDSSDLLPPLTFVQQKQQVYCQKEDGMLIRVFQSFPDRRIVFVGFSV